MHWGVTYETEGGPSPLALAQAIEELTRQNVSFFLREWAAGREPPCCTGCAGLKHRPDRPGQMMRLIGARALLREGAGSCHSIAAYAAGHARAKALTDGASPGEAARVAVVVLVPSREWSARDGYYHALVRTPGGDEDPSEELESL